ncbi:hypothetical protein ACO2J1_12395 [Leptospira interrogans]|uniref:hypothetical protein n=1 Tax=Leptospira interrogans TaxID=173 RepID=UPI000979E6AC|nr:hypothetical protein [Leptospira interrogans]ASV05985.1 hypothetical protein B2G47_08235 [Leptospira interrogans serovar Canicola]ASV08521.1 hypothetical protein B2G50_04955 [Leptospira interrogans serovar Canicola]MCH5432508.1 hypothetical protein [Leptospira interrogans serovar Canicola]OLZ31392.1 hypothetical protein AR546_11245 [Leptospira interrogans serovar Canicola]POR15153.1 hypothetical protein B0T34_19780 [Leptospira interrogans serovar Canicola]
MAKKAQVPPPLLECREIAARKNNGFLSQRPEALSNLILFQNTLLNKTTRFDIESLLNLPCKIIVKTKEF